MVDFTCSQELLPCRSNHTTTTTTPPAPPGPIQTPDTRMLNICLDIFQVDRSHRLNGPKRPESDNSQVIRPIIVKFATYRSRNLVFKAKKLLKGSSIAIFENLMTHRASLLKDVNRNAWTMDGNILTFNMEGKIFTVRRIEDIRKVRPNCF